MNSRIRGVLSVGPLGAMGLAVKLTRAPASSVMGTCPGIHGAGGMVYWRVGTTTQKHTLYQCWKSQCQKKERC